MERRKARLFPSLANPVTTNSTRDCETCKGVERAYSTWSWKGDLCWTCSSCTSPKVKPNERIKIITASNLRLRGPRLSAVCQLPDAVLFTDRVGPCGSHDV